MVRKPLLRPESDPPSVEEEERAFEAALIAARRPGSVVNGVHQLVVEDPDRRRWDVLTPALAKEAYAKTGLVARNTVRGA